MIRLIVIIFFAFKCEFVKANNLSNLIYQRLILASYDLSNIQDHDQLITNHEVYIFLGNDGLDNVYNDSLGKSLFSLLTRECRILSDFYCGFQKKTSEKLQRTIRGSRISITLLSPKVGFETNLSEKFLNALNSDAQVIYLGHSRFGKGVDFYPASQGRSISASKIARAISHSQLWLISCSSQKHFSEIIKNEIQDAFQLVTTLRSVSVQEAEKVLMYSLLHRLYAFEDYSLFEKVFNVNLLR